LEELEGKRGKEGDMEYWVLVVAMVVWLGIEDTKENIKLK
jgi:hypothetical protein